MDRETAWVILISLIIACIIFLAISFGTTKIDCNENNTFIKKVKRNKIQVCDGADWIPEQEHNRRLDYYVMGTNDTLNSIYFNLKDCETMTLSQNNVSIQIASVECVLQQLQQTIPR